MLAYLFGLYTARTHLSRRIARLVILKWLAWLWCRDLGTDKCSEVSCGVSFDMQFDSGRMHGPLLYYPDALHVFPGWFYQAAMPAFLPCEHERISCPLSSLL